MMINDNQWLGISTIYQRYIPIFHPKLMWPSLPRLGEAQLQPGTVETPSDTPVPAEPEEEAAPDSQAMALVKPKREALVKPKHGLNVALVPARSMAPYGTCVQHWSFWLFCHGIIASLHPESPSLGPYPMEPMGPMGPMGSIGPVALRFSGGS